VSTVGKLFRPKPDQWGYRGDPYLWEDLRRVFNAVPVPANPVLLEQMLRGVIVALTGASWTSDQDHVSVDRYAAGGMSSGMVSTEFWQSTTIPLLVSRYLVGTKKPPSRCSEKTFG